MGMTHGKGKHLPTHWLKVLCAKDELGRKIQCVIHPPQTDMGALLDIEKLLAEHNPTKHKLQFVIYKTYWAEVLPDDMTPTGNTTTNYPSPSERSN